MYTAKTLVTFLHFNSCQIWDSLLGLGLALLTASYGVWGCESSAGAASMSGRTKGTGFSNYAAYIKWKILLTLLKAANIQKVVVKLE